MGKKRIAWHKRLLQILGICLAIFTLCSVSFAEQLDPRWKWVYSSSHQGWYFDTQTVEYDKENQVATYWLLILDEYGNKRSATRESISFINKKLLNVQYVYHDKYGNLKSVTPQKKSIDSGISIPPDSTYEKIANEIASILNIPPLYEGGPNRWKWLHSNDEYGLYIAEDTIVYEPYSGYSVWTQKKYLDGRSPETKYIVNLSEEVIDGAYPPHHPIPDTDEEYIYNDVKKLIENA